MLDPRRATLTTALISSGTLLVVPAAPAHAYIDGGTGSYLLQLLLAGLFAASIMAKVFWERLVAMFGRKRTDDEGTHGK
jgi:hypothetical protein